MNSDFRDLLRLFAKHDARYLIVGGILIACFGFVACGSRGNGKYPGDCVRREQATTQAPATAIQIYQVDSISWMNESEAKAVAKNAISLQGKEAKEVWDAMEQGIDSRVQVSVTGLPYRTQNHLMFLTNTQGEKWSVKIGTVSRGTDEWYLSCRWAEKVWTAWISPELAKALGVDWE